MDTQEDSLDIAYEQRRALGLVDEASQPLTDVQQPPMFNEISLLTCSPFQSRRIGLLEGNELPAVAGDHSASRGNTSSSIQGGISGPCFPLIRQPKRHAAPVSSPRQSISQPELPSTVPESQFRKMSSQGDTQPVSQSFYDDLINRNSPVDPDLPNRQFAHDDTTQLTLLEGDTGHLDLLSDFKHNQVGDRMANENGLENDKSSSPTFYLPNLFPESQRFLRTPMTVKKPGDMPDTTPSASRNPLGTGGRDDDLLPLSQVFNVTQAQQSSPFGHLLPSSARPSPNIPIQRGPIDVISSPLRTTPTLYGSDTVRPETRYVSMKESQAMRERLAEERRTRSMADLNSAGKDDDDGFEGGDSFVSRQIRQRRIDKEAEQKWANVTVPARPGSSVRRKGSRSSASSASSPLKRLSTQEQNDAPPVIVPLEPQEDLIPTDQGGTSEDETEQEDETNQEPGRNTQQLQSSSEEDKENFDTDAASYIDSTARAHDALSQALDLNNPSVNGQSTDNQTNDDGQKAIQGDIVASSSQVIKVMDSQRSPEPEGGQHNGASNVIPCLESDQAAPYPAPRSQNGRLMDEEVIASSPARKSQPPPSSPPHEDTSPIRSQGSVRGGNSHSHGGPRGHTDINSTSSSENAHQLPAGIRGVKSGQEALHIRSKAASQLGIKSASDNGEKSSSIPSRIYETPVHTRPRKNFQQTIPETSPTYHSFSALRRDVIPEDAAFPPPDASKEDDNDLPLPPLRREPESDMAMQILKSTPLQVGLSGATILSSPSGRQRRALTEIAADASPSQNFGDVDIEIGFFTAEDANFQSAVGYLSRSPLKKRRGNDGRVIPASDPIRPTTPDEVLQPQFRELSDHLESPDSSEVPADIVKSRVKSRPRPDNLWDVEDSPQTSQTSTSQAQPVLHTRRTVPPGRLNKPKRSIRHPLPNRTVVIDHKKSLPVIPQAETSSALEIGETVESSDPIQGNTPLPPQEQRVIGNYHVSDPQVLAPNQVFACYNGRTRAYFPATCFGMPQSIPRARYHVKFENTDSDVIDAQGVKKLELKVDDVVKVDMQSMPKTPYVVRGFKDKLDQADIDRQIWSGAPLMTDVYGHSTVLLTPKQRKSLSVADARNETEEIIAVPLARVYLDTVLWGRLNDREFLYIQSAGGSTTRLETPIDKSSELGTPRSKHRITGPTDGLFAGMVFAVSYGDKEDVKNRVLKLIDENGGQVLQDGFHELFEIPKITPPSSPSGSTAEKSPDADAPESLTHFRLASGNQGVGFACLLADKHSRRAKYMQALALNIPCLSGRWVEDCVHEHRLLGWEPYLLPAGESKFLGGATRSRVLAPSSPETARLCDTIAARPKLLEGQSVLLITGRGKAQEKRDAYVFLTYALGAQHVDRVPDLKGAKAALAKRQQDIETRRDDNVQQGNWDLIYVDDNEVKTAKSLLFGAPSSGHGGKRRRRSERNESVDSNATALSLSSSGKIVGNDFICQSLILGRLFDS